MRALLVCLLLAALVVTLATLLSESGEDRPTHSAPAPALSPPPRPVAGSGLSDEQIDRQDPPDPIRQRSEALAHDRRPLLNALPVVVHGVSFDIGGLAGDDRTTIIRADARSLGERQARIAFQTLRRLTGDRSRSYRLDVSP